MYINSGENFEKSWDLFDKKENAILTCLETSKVNHITRCNIFAAVTSSEEFISFIEN